MSLVVDEIVKVENNLKLKNNESSTFNTTLMMLNFCKTMNFKLIFRLIKNLSTKSEFISLICLVYKKDYIYL